MHVAETYVLRTIPLDAIDADVARDLDPPPMDAHERKAALRFDTPIVAAEVLLAPAASGRYRVLAGLECLSRARASGRGLLFAAVAPTPDAEPRALGRWHLHHAA